MGITLVQIRIVEWLYWDLIRGPCSVVRPQGSKPGILETLGFDPKPSNVGLLSVLASPTEFTVYEVYGIYGLGYAGFRVSGFSLLDLVAT